MEVMQKTTFINPILQARHEEQTLRMAYTKAKTEWESSWHQRTFSQIRGRDRKTLLGVEPPVPNLKKPKEKRIRNG